MPPEDERPSQNEPSGEQGTRRRKTLARFEMMPGLVEQDPLDPKAFADIVAGHREFIASGGGGGYWETLTSSSERKIGVVFGVYRPAHQGQTDGEQAKLSHKRMDGLDLRKVELPYADLCGASGRTQDLSDANLAGCLATDSDFSGSNFENADLSGADFSRADLAGCNFRNADLSRTDFENADLSGADLRGAKIDATRFPGAELGGVLF